MLRYTLQFQNALEPKAPTPMTTDNPITVQLLLTGPEHRCLTHFLRDRKHLWRRTARDAGISDPERVLKVLAEAGRERA